MFHYCHCWFIQALVSSSTVHETEEILLFFLQNTILSNNFDGLLLFVNLLEIKIINSSLFICIVKIEQVFLDGQSVLGRLRAFLDDVGIKLTKWLADLGVHKFGDFGVYHQLLGWANHFKSYWKITEKKIT